MITQLRIHRGAPSPPLLVLLVLRVVLFASVTDGAIRCDRDPLPSASAPIAAVSLHSHVHQYLILISANSRVPRCGSFCSHTPVNLPTQQALLAAPAHCTLTLHVLVCIHRTLVSSSLDTAHKNMWSCARECRRCACMCAPGYVHVLRVGVLASTMHTLPLLSDLLKALKCPSTTGSPGSSTVRCPLHCDTPRASRHRFLTCKVIYAQGSRGLHSSLCHSL